MPVLAEMFVTIVYICVVLWAVWDTEQKLLCNAVCDINNVIPGIKANAEDTIPVCNTAHKTNPCIPEVLSIL